MFSHSFIPFLVMVTTILNFELVTEVAFQCSGFSRAYSATHRLVLGVMGFVADCP